MGKIKAFLELFRKGKAVADPAVWKDRAKLANALTLAISAAIGAAYALGYDLPVGGESIELIAGGVAALWVGGYSVYRTITNADKGLPAKPGAND